MDIIEEIKFPLNDSEWVKKVLIGGVLGIIPIINLIVLGYYLKVLEGGFESRSEMPEWDDWGGFLINGLIVLAIGLVYMIIPVVVIFISAGGIVLTALSGDTIIGAAGIAAAIGGSLIGVILMLLFGFLVPMALAMYVKEDLLGAAFKFKEILSRIKSVLGDYIVVYIVVMILWFILSMIACIPFIGWLIMMFGNFYIAVIGANMFGKVFVNSSV